MKQRFLVESISFFFVLLFLYTATAKLLELHSFREQLLSSPLLENFAGFITWTLPIGEILLCIALFIPAWRIYGLYATFILMVVFTGYVITIFFMDNQLSCSCGGIVENLTPARHIVFNSACILLSGLSILIHRRQVPTIRFKWLMGSSAICLFLLLGWTLFTAFTTPDIAKTGKEGRLLPSFDLLLTDSSTKLNTAAIPTGKSFIVIGFSPFCTHCQAETKDIIQHMESWKDTRIYFVTPYPFQQMKAFYSYFKLKEYPNIIMGQDMKNAYFKYFSTSSVPYTTIYDPKKRLKRVFNGETNTANLIKAIDN